MKNFYLVAVMLFIGLWAVSCSNGQQNAGKVDYEMSYTVNGSTIEMTKVPAGSFAMGISRDNKTKVTGGVVHEVALDGFVVMSQPVSQALWTAVMGSNPASTQNPEFPVDMVSWLDVQKFISKLNKLTGKSFSLPTEAQWEYANLFLESSAKVLSSEWCLDSYSEPTEAEGSLTDPRVLSRNPVCAEKNGEKLVRETRSRIAVDCHTRKASVGFRLVQPTEDALSDAILIPFDGNKIDREAVDASKGGFETFTVGDVTFKMVKVQGGTFQMGCTENYSPFPNFSIPENEKIIHDVTLDSFAIGETEVTTALWTAVMGYTPYLNNIKEGNKPVGNVSWYDCQRFVQKLNALTGRKFRLPTEAEWEYAAKGGQKSKHFIFAGGDEPKTTMWYQENADMKSMNVKTKMFNELGLYDMSGNVWEWCFDRSADYTTNPQTNPTGADEGYNRIMRGGSCASRWEACRTTNRSAVPARSVKGSFGLRLAL